MGVGKGVKYGDTSTNRKVKPWYSKTFFAEIERLKEILVVKYGQKAQFTIIDTVQKTEI